MEATTRSSDFQWGAIISSNQGREWKGNMIKRREFGAALVGMAAPGITRSYVAATQKPPKNTLMHVGGDYHSVAGGDITSKQNLEYNLRHGVKHLTAAVRKRPQV